MLDVGCAAGGFAEIYAPTTRRSPTRARTFERLLEAARALHPEAEFVEADAIEGLPFGKRTFDVVQALGWLHWEHEHRAALRELWRVSRRAGSSSTSGSRQATTPAPSRATSGSRSPANGTARPRSRTSRSPGPNSPLSWRNWGRSASLATATSATLRIPLARCRRRSASRLSCSRSRPRGPVGAARLPRCAAVVATRGGLGRRAAPGRARRARSRGRAMSVVALMLGRANSSGFPGKNVIPVLGRPLMAYGLIAANDSRHVDQHLRLDRLGRDRRYRARLRRRDDQAPARAVHRRGSRRGRLPPWLRDHPRPPRDRRRGDRARRAAVRERGDGHRRADRRGDREAARRLLARLRRDGVAVQHVEPAARAASRRRRHAEAVRAVRGLRRPRRRSPTTATRRATSGTPTWAPPSRARAASPSATTGSSPSAGWAGGSPRSSRGAAATSTTNGSSQRSSSGSPSTA